MRIVHCARIASIVATLVGLAVTASSTQPAYAFDTKAYQAEYELTGGGQKQIHRLSFDGKGHGRSEMISPSRHSISIIDLGNHQMKILDANTKTVINMSLRSDNIDQLIGLGNKIDSTAMPLGVKVIDGHTCVGTHYKLDGGSEQDIWTGNDISGTRVYSKVFVPGFGVSEAHLKSYLSAPPSDDAFKVPADYRVR